MLFTIFLQIGGKFLKMVPVLLLNFGTFLDGTIFVLFFRTLLKYVVPFSEPLSTYFGVKKSKGG